MLREKESRKWANNQNYQTISDIVDDKMKTVKFDILEDAVNEFATIVRNWTDTVNKTDFRNPMMARMLNDQMIEMDKIFLTTLPRDMLDSHALVQGGLRYGRASFPGIEKLLKELLEKTTSEIDTWDGWELLNRHVTEIYVMIVQATSHLKPFHLL